MSILTLDVVPLMYFAIVIQKRRIDCSNTGYPYPCADYLAPNRDRGFNLSRRLSARRFILSVFSLSRFFSYICASVRADRKAPNNKRIFILH